MGDVFDVQWYIIWSLNNSFFNISDIFDVVEVMYKVFGQVNFYCLCVDVDIIVLDSLYDLW